MALPAQSYIWFRLRHVVGLWVSYVTDLPATAVLFDGQDMPRPVLPYVGLVRRDFPLAYFDDELILEVPTAVTLTVTAATLGETVALVLFGTRYAYTQLFPGIKTSRAIIWLQTILNRNLEAMVCQHTINGGVELAEMFMLYT